MVAYLNGNPVVALTLRYDRIGCFWFTLMHELAHITTGHKGIYLDDLDKSDINAEESEANRLSRDWLLNSEAFAALKATKPYFSRKCIEQFAQSQVGIQASFSVVSSVKMRLVTNIFVPCW